MRFVMACGGTGGHINPALAVANLLRAEGHDILFMGAHGGLEDRLVPREGYELRHIDVRSLRHSRSLTSLWTNARVMASLPGLLRKARKILREFRPDAMLGTGGYASYVPGRAAAGLGIPLLIHESNAQPGVATRLLSERAAMILVGMEECRAHYKNADRVRVVGTPVRREFTNRNRVLARQQLRLDNRPLIVSLFGSGGAEAMNRLMLDVLAREAARGDRQHIHATGLRDYGWMCEEAARRGLDFDRTPGLRMVEYIYDMADAMAAADVVVGRSGASTMAELMASARPSILIPSPNVAADHQTANAKALEALGGAVLLPESEATAERLTAELDGLLRARPRLDAMSGALARAFVPDSAGMIKSLLLEVAQRAG